MSNRSELIPKNLRALENEVRDAEAGLRDAWWSIPAVILIAVGPILSSVIASAVASMFGKQLNEGSAPDIPIIGGLLYVMGVFAWLSLMTIPLGLVCFPICLIAFVRCRIKLSKAQARLRTMQSSEDQSAS